MQSNVFAELYYLNVLIPARFAPLKQRGKYVLLQLRGGQSEQKNSFH